MMISITPAIMFPWLVRETLLDIVMAPQLYYLLSYCHGRLYGGQPQQIIKNRRIINYLLTSIVFAFKRPCPKQTRNSSSVHAPSWCQHDHNLVCIQVLYKTIQYSDVVCIQVLYKPSPYSEVNFLHCTHRVVRGGQSAGHKPRPDGNTLPCGVISGSGSRNLW